MNIPMSDCLGCKYRQLNPDIGFMCRRNDEVEECYEETENNDSLYIEEEEK